MKTFSLTLIRFLFFFFAFGVSLYALQYFNFRTDNNILHSKPADLLAQWPWRIGFYGHIAAGILSLCIGPFQFLRKFRAKNLPMHRRFGKVYVFAILAGSVCAFYAALFANEGIIAQIGFMGLAVAWFYTTLRAYQTIRKGDLPGHKRWMVRSYACTMAAVTLRIWLPLGMVGFHFSFHDMYRAVAWLCWVPNLFVAEWLIYSKKFEY